MRLIDADELIKGRVENDPVVIMAKCAPTAYDVDKVVEHLNKDYENTDNDELLTSAEKEAVLCRITRDIDIIKAGGVNEKKTEKPDYQNSAGILQSRQRGKETL